MDEDDESSSDECLRSCLRSVCAVVHGVCAPAAVVGAASATPPRERHPRGLRLAVPIEFRPGRPAGALAASLPAIFWCAFSSSCVCVCVVVGFLFVFLVCLFYCFGFLGVLFASGRDRDASAPRSGSGGRGTARGGEPRAEPPPPLQEKAAAPHARGARAGIASWLEPRPRPPAEA